MARRARSIAVGVHGRLHMHPWIDGGGEDGDCYSAFHALGSSLGLLVAPPNAIEDGPGLWGMNDAGGPWAGEDEATLCGWFQVAPWCDGRASLPVEPFTIAAVMSVGRFGELDLCGLEYYLPLCCAGPAARRLLSGRNWTELAHPEARTRVRMTVDSGDETVIVDRMSDVLSALDAFSPTEEAFDFERADALPAVEFPTTAPWREWLGDAPDNIVTLTATVSEWGPIALGRAVAYVVEACRRVGITDGVGVRITRT